MYIKKMYRELLLLIFYLISQAFCYKPVILLHGIMTGAESMELIKARIQEKHPGTIIYNIERFGGWSSLDNLNYQVQQISQDFNNFTLQHPGGIHLLGYSQGALLARTILQANLNHSVHTFISLSGPQAGQYGTQFLHLFFPGLALETAYELFYSRVGQHTSVGNYWNDPYHKQLYVEYSQFLPYVNNELLTNSSKQYKDALTKLKTMVLIGGPDDNVITPWQSSQFGYYDSNGTVIDLMERDIFKDDKIGLKTLYGKKKLKIISVPGINHFEWHLNVSIVDNFILSYLD
ncbi:lysosomal thioesterase PPT2 homolog isoform X1 [Anthonomus grandis grandis]|uniref:lysosomal thioesterase PPT2 homolog isoform X1 n=1 Tax=Anthonomus grandis grandis TaxID=2921223 RepID=UPI0021666FE7|nr:lysosomal thioesterase PPT2 homolog isoform X1 [Anthonomus grandis grandis]